MSRHFHHVFSGNAQKVLDGNMVEMCIDTVRQNTVERCNPVGTCTVHNPSFVPGSAVILVCHNLVGISVWEQDCYDTHIHTACVLTHGYMYSTHACTYTHTHTHTHTHTQEH